MYVNKIYVDQVALARSLAASVAVQDVPAPLPRRRRHRKAPPGGSRLLRLIRWLRQRPAITRIDVETPARTNRREYVRRPVDIKQTFLQSR